MIPSKIVAMKVNPNKPGVAYKKSVRENVPNDLQKGWYSNKIKQIENAQYNEMCSKRMNKHEFAVFYKLATELDDYVRKI